MALSNRAVLVLSKGAVSALSKGAVLALAKGAVLPFGGFKRGCFGFSKWAVLAL